MKRAFIVGINYVGSAAELRGCINDARNMENLLKKQMGFDEVKLCLENDATTAGIMNGLKWLVSGAVPGDVLVFHYSGHGSQVRSNTEPDALDEIICPIDLDWKTRVIKDDDLKAIFNTVPNGVNITIILDCCHSGSGLDQADTLFSARDLLGGLGDSTEARSLAVSELGLNPEEGISRYLPPPPEALAEIEEKEMHIREWKTSRDVNRTALLIAGCLPNQTSADAYIAGEYQGAATFSLMQALAQGKKTYRQIAEHMSGFMQANGFTQRPQLDGHPSLYDQIFLEPWGFGGGVSQVPAPGTWKNPPDGQTQLAQPKKKLNRWVSLAIIVAVTAIAFFLSAR